MTEEQALTYETIDRPYDELLRRGVNTETKVEQETDDGRSIKTGTALNDAWIDTWIKSRNYQPKKQGFYLDARTGYIEAMKLYIGSGGIVGGSLDIPDTVTPDSFHVESDGDTFWGTTPALFTADNTNADAYVLKTGAARFANINVTGGTIGGQLVSDVGLVSTPAAEIVPTGLTASSTGVSVSSTGSIVANVVLTWNAIATSTFDHYVIRFKIGTYTFYTYLTSTANTITIDGLAPNVAYNFGIASVNKFGTSSAFSADINQTTAKSTTAPATVAGVSSVAGIQYVIVQWTKNTEGDVSSYNIYRNTVNDSATATLIGNSFTNYFIDGGLTGGTPYYYFIKALNTSALLSAAFSVVTTATPRNIITSDVGTGQITAPLTSLNAINSTTGDLNINTVGTTQIVDNSVGSQKGNIAIRGWTQTCTFTVTDADTIAWGAGTFTASDGTSYAISAGNTGNMAAKTYIYLNIGVSTTAYQTTTTATTAVGDGKVLIAIAQNGTNEATFMLLNNNSYNIDAANIVAGSITANEIAAGAVIASKITSYNFQVSAGTFTNNSPIAGEIAWTGVKVVYNGTEYSITNGNCLTTDKHVYWQLASPTVFAASATLPALGNDDFLVLFNNSGTALYVWNSTIVNGNRITTGSITSTNMAANSITANAIEAGAVTANKITSNSFAFSAGTFSANSPGAGRVSWAGCKVVYQGTEYSITDGNCLATEKHIYWQLASPTVFATSIALPALGNDDFLVVFNDSGTPKYVWNSTIINGNRITTGSVSATQIDTASITSLSNLSITASQVLIDGAVYLSNWRKSGALTKIDGGELYVGSLIEIASSGHIRSGQTAYNTGIGWWLGDVAGAPKLSMGNPADSYLTYDSSTGAVSLKGSITITGGSGYANLSDKPTLGTLSGLNTADFATNVSGAQKPENNATVGANWSTNLSNIPGTLGTPGAAGLYLSSTYMGYYTGAVWNSYIDNSGNFFFKGDANNQIDWNVTTAGTLTIKGNMTAGNISGVTITGGTVQTASSGQRIVMASNVMEFYNSTPTNIASLNGGALSATTFLKIESPSAAPFYPISINQKGAGKEAITIVCDDSGAGSQGILLQNDGDATSFYLHNGSTSAGIGLNIYNEGDGIGLQIDSLATSSAYPMKITNNGTGARALYIDNATANNSTGIYVTNPSASNANNTAEFYKAGGAAGDALYASITGIESQVAGNFKQATAKSTNFWRVLELTGGTTNIYIWVSDGTDPNGVLSATQGAVCYNCDANGLVKHCAGGTTWA